MPDADRYACSNSRQITSTSALDVIQLSKAKGIAAKRGIKAKRLQAGWDEAYLLNVLVG